jgi:hypothetical protein
MTIKPCLPILAAGIGLLGCGDSTGVSVDDLQGTWMGTVAVFTNAANTSQTVDLIAAGLSLSLIIEAGGEVTINLAAGGVTEVQTGTISTSGSDVTLVLDGAPSKGTILRTDDRLTLDLSTGVEWDFDADNIIEPATAHFVFQRTG